MRTAKLSRERVADLDIATTGGTDDVAGWLHFDLPFGAGVCSRKVQGYSPRKVGSEARLELGKAKPTSRMAARGLSKLGPFQESFRMDADLPQPELIDILPNEERILADRRR